MPNVALFVKSILNFFMPFTKEQVLDIVKGNRWNVQSFNGMPLYLMCAATLSGWRVAEELGIGYSHFFYLFSKGRAHMYYDEADWRAIADAYYARVHSEKDLNAMMERCMSRVEATRASVAYGDVVKLTLPELIELTRKLAMCITDSVGTGHALEGMTFGSEERLKKLLEDRGDFSMMDYSLLCSPLASSFMTGVQEVLLRIKELSEGAERDAEIANYIRDYAWAEATYQGLKKLTPADVLVRANELKEITAIDVAGISAQKEELMKELSFTNEERFIVKTIETSFKWQDDRKMHILQSIAAIDPVIDHLAERCGIQSMSMRFVLLEELTLAKLTDATFAKELDLRKEKSAYFTIPEGTTIFTGDDYGYLSTNLHMSFDEEISEIKGMVASRGITRGIVRVCESISSIDRVQTGEILVASMTRPEYLPAMQRAAAFITDEGGITCHAAIVSREMNKPCIIGTKFATKVLRDGDEVEVDAEKGLVRVLSR